MNENKQGAVDGFDGAKGPNTFKQKNNWTKNPPVGKWRNHDNILKIEYTYIVCE